MVLMLLIAFAIGACVGASAAFVWQAWTRKSAPLPLGEGWAMSGESLTTSSTLTTAHIHDFHVGGKDKGLVRFECECGEVRY